MERDVKLDLTSPLSAERVYKVVLNQDNGKGVRMTVIPSKNRLVVDVKKVGDAHCLPIAD